MLTSFSEIIEQLIARHKLLTELGGGNYPQDIVIEDLLDNLVFLERRSKT